jgi:hypothetical protein
MIYRNTITMELVNATIRTIKGKLTAVVINISNNISISMDESVFTQYFQKIKGKDELTAIEILRVNKFFK